MSVQVRTMIVEHTYLNGTVSHHLGVTTIPPLCLLWCKFMLVAVLQLPSTPLTTQIYLITKVHRLLSYAGDTWMEVMPSANLKKIMDKFLSWMEYLFPDSDIASGEDRIKRQRAVAIGFDIAGCQRSCMNGLRLNKIDFHRAHFAAFIQFLLYQRPY